MGRFTKAIVNMGFKQSESDHTLFIKHSTHSTLGGVTVLLVYVDDVIVTRNDLEGIRSLQSKLMEEFQMKDLGRLKYLLGIAVAYSKHGIFISQQKYVLDLLTEEGKLGCKPMETPIKQNHRLCKEGKCPSKLKQNQKPSKPPPLEPPVNKESY